MHIQRREKALERRLPTPKWAVNDAWLSQLLVVYLEERFYVRRDTQQSLPERLAKARAAADRYAPRKRELLKAWVELYHKLSTAGLTLDDEECVRIFAEINDGQLPISAGVARDYLNSKKLQDLEIQIQNIDTDIVLTERGHATVIASIVYQYYRLGWHSVQVATNLGLKSPHVRQVLARLHATWAASLSHLDSDMKASNAEDKNPSGLGLEGAGSPSLDSEDADQLPVTFE